METKMKKFTVLLCTLFLVSCSNDEAAESEIVDNAGTIAVSYTHLTLPTIYSV